MAGTCNYLGCHLPHFPHPCPEHLSLRYSADGQFHPLSSQYLKVLASVDNTAVGATAAYTDGNAVPAAVGSTPLAVKYTFYSINNTMKWLKIQLTANVEWTTTKIVMSCTSGTKRYLDIVILHTLKHAKLSAPSNLMERPNHIISHLVCCPVFPAALSAPLSSLLT